jgi:RNA polymerase sigma-70 factor (sigma-E family)
MDHEDERAFEHFVRATSTRLFRTAYLLAGDRERAEDLLQSTYERVYRRWPTVAAADQPEAYARRILVNLSTDRWRRARHLLEVPWEEHRSDTAGPAVDPTGTVDLRHQLIAGLRSLPPAMRAVVVLRYWEDLPEQQVARELRCSVGSVKSQASRGLRRLRGVLGSEGRHPPPAAAPAPVAVPATAGASRGAVHGLR